MCLKTCLLSPASPSFSPESHDFVQTWRREKNEIREGGVFFDGDCEAFYLCQCPQCWSLREEQESLVSHTAQAEDGEWTLQAAQTCTGNPKYQFYLFKEHFFKQSVDHWEMTRLKYRLHSDEVMTTTTVF